MVCRNSRSGKRTPRRRNLPCECSAGLAKHRLLLAVAIVVMPPASVSITKKLPTNADVVVCLNFTKAFSIFELDGIGATALRNLSARGHLALRKHLSCLVASDRILRQYIIGNVVNAYLIVCSGRRSQNRHCCSLLLELSLEEFVIPQFKAPGNEPHRY